MPVLPGDRPRLSTAELAQSVRPSGYDLGQDPLVVVGIRGFYRDELGVPGANDRGCYDDALFIHSANGTVSFNGNTDPSTFRPGTGTGTNRGMACLVPGVWRVHQFDLHKGQYLALCQRAGPVTVQRDGDPPYLHTGLFGINIHRGGDTGTWSEGCQTVPRAQWDSFISLASDLALRAHGNAWRRAVIPYVLIDNPGSDPSWSAPAFALAPDPSQERSTMPPIPGYNPAGGPLAVTMTCNYQSIGALGVYCWRPGDGNNWTVIHTDTTWKSSSGPIVAPTLTPGSKLYWVIGLTTTAFPPANVAAKVVLSQDGRSLDMVPVAGLATGAAIVQDHRTYTL